MRMRIDGFLVRKISYIYLIPTICFGVKYNLPNSTMHNISLKWLKWHVGVDYITKK